MLANTARNVHANVPPDAPVRILGYDWTQPTTPLLDELASLEAGRARGAGGWDAAGREGAGRPSFELIFMSDLLYELEHQALLHVAKGCLSRSRHAQVLVSFQPHDPVQFPKQMNFFALATCPPFSFHVEHLRTAPARRMFDAPSAEPSAPAVDDAEPANAHLREQAFLYALTLRAPLSESPLSPP